MSASPSLTGRALVALGLMVGFYLLAVAIAAGLFYIPYAEWTYAGRLHVKLGIGCVVLGALILWSVLPRLDRFVAPGPPLERDRQPRLFAEIDSIAKATGQRIPSEVYLVGDVNAWVSQRGGLMGFGSRRVMGLGLPLLRTLTRSQLRAVLAHEFGHFHGGDTRLGPLVYRTREAIGRTLVALSNDDGSASLVQAPFRWYARMFLRVSHSISRRQELCADALAARTVGAAPLITGLRSVHAAGRAFPSYWRSEFLPLLQSGFLPPLADGFAEFLRAEEVSRALAKAMEEERSERGSPYDTHPPLPERVAALEALPPGEASTEDPPALALLDGVPGLERAWVASISSAEAAARLVSIPWDAAGPEAYLPGWRALLRANAANLRGTTLGGIDTALAAGRSLSRFVGTDGEPSAQPLQLAREICSAALGLALLERGARLEALPGRPIHLHLAGETLAPATLVHDLIERKLTGEEWRALCSRHGVDGLDLGELADRQGAAAGETR